MEKKYLIVAADYEGKTQVETNNFYNPCQSPEKVQLCCNPHLIHLYFSPVIGMEIC